MATICALQPERFNGVLNEERGRKGTLAKEMKKKKAREEDPQSIRTRGLNVEPGSADHPYVVGIASNMVAVRYFIACSAQFDCDLNALQFNGVQMNANGREH